MLSDDSDADRDTKYNLLDESDMIDEEDECLDYDDEDDGEYGAEEYTCKHLNSSHSSSCENIMLASMNIGDQLQLR